MFGKQKARQMASRKHTGVLFLTMGPYSPTSDIGIYQFTQFLADAFKF